MPFIEPPRESAVRIVHRPSDGTDVIYFVAEDCAIDYLLPSGEGEPPRAALTLQPFARQHVTGPLAAGDAGGKRSLG